MRWKPVGASAATTHPWSLARRTTAGDPDQVQADPTPPAEPPGVAPAPVPPLSPPPLTERGPPQRARAARQWQ